MPTRLTGFAILGFAFLGNNAVARPKLYTLIELVGQAPLIVTGRVNSKTADVANVAVATVVKGNAIPPEIQLRDISRRLPRTPGLRLVPGEQVMLFLKTRGEFFTADHQSKLDVSGSNRLAELVRLYLSTSGNDEQGAADATAGIHESIRSYDELSVLARRFLLQVAGRNTLKLPPATIDRFLGRGMKDDTAKVRWEAFAMASRLDLVLEQKSAFLLGIQDDDRRVRAVSFAALRQKAGETFGFDPNLPAKQQPNALAQWRSWAVQNR